MGALQATSTSEHVRSGAHTHLVNQYLGVVYYSKCAIVETELRFDRKLQEANIDQSEGDGKL